MRSVVVIAAVLVLSCGPETRYAPVGPTDLEAIAALSRGSAQPTSALTRGKGPVLVVFRNQGELEGRQWLEGDSWWAALEQALPGKPSDTLEICLTYDYRPVSELQNVERGILGLEVRGEERLAPTEMIARNLSWEAARRQLGPGPARRFQAHQILITPTRQVLMLRGNQLVGPPDERELGRAARGMAGYLRRQLHPSGRLTYKWWPSQGKASPADNPLRQFMASWALARWAREDPTAESAARRNLASNMRRFYHDGVIEYRGEVKLGAIAVAALAILDSPVRDRYQEELQALIAATHNMQREDGSFQTFLKPRTRENDNQNFYPGEALLLWARLGERDRFMQSFRYYREFHRKNPNPAFVPWHTRACAEMYAQTGDPELKDFVFEMNDWLLGPAGMQPSEPPYPDLEGRFYNPLRPDFGPPHASSTGAYLEGLAEACRLAQGTPRGDRYKAAWWRGARHLVQLQFQDEVDMFYVARRGKVRGGLRTEVYDNAIRVDNVQHALMAFMAYQRIQGLRAAGR